MPPARSSARSWRTIPLPAFGTLLEKSGPHVPGIGVFDFLLGLYGTLVNPDLDVMIDVTSLSGLPILGDGIMMDGTSDAKSLRMASHMLASTPNSHLIDPDLSTQSGGIIRTVLGLYNPGPAATGPITLRYFDRAGAPIGPGGTIPTLLPNQPVRIPPGVFGNPANAGYGWVDIQGCSGADRLVGWTVREIVTPSSSPGIHQYHKVFGEILDGNGGSEPGPGFLVTNALGTFVRKSAPFLRTNPSPQWSGYMTFANTTAPNVGPHFFRFFAANGADCTNFFLQPFAGVPWAATSTTLEDPQSLCSVNQSGRADLTNGTVNGIVVLGNRLYDHNIPGLAGRPPVYAGPGDVVPTFGMPGYPVEDEDDEEEEVPVGPEGDDGLGG